MSAGSRKRRAPKLGVTWFGHSAFLLESPAGTRVLVDPWLENPKAPAGAAAIDRVDLILVTHGHSDHVGQTVPVAKRTGAKVVCIYELALHLGGRGVEGVTGMNKGGTLAVEGVSVTMTDAKHSADIDADGKVVPGGEAAGFVIRFENGYSVYHSGDTCAFLDMKLIQKLHRPSLAILPIGGLYTMDPREAALACRMLTPRKIIGMHYGTFPALAGTPAELRKHLPGKMRESVLELVPGIRRDI